MASRFGELFGFADSQTQKLQKEIINMEQKKGLLISAVEQEIQTYKQKIDGVFRQIGAEVYSYHMQDVDFENNLDKYFEEITALNNLIAEKETKIREITFRYDEEIGMLKSHLSVNDFQLTSTVPVNNNLLSSNANTSSNAGNVHLNTDNTSFCGNCGTAYVQDEDFFCMTCGQRLT